MAGDMAGTKNRRSELSIPLSATATATSIRKGSTIRVMLTVSDSKFWPSGPENSFGSRLSRGSAKIIPRMTRVPVTTIRALRTRLPRRQAAACPCSFQ